MALKDWKKTRSGKTGIRWVNEKTGIIVFLHTLKKEWGFIHDVLAVEVMGSHAEHIITKDFKTKSQALRFAKEYMRTH